jgi:hypothetical protein
VLNYSLLRVTKERVAVVVFTVLLLWVSGAPPPHIAAAVAGVAYFWWFLRPRVVHGVRAPHHLSTSELEAIVWRYEHSYFDWLGPSELCVLEFRHLVESRDIGRLSASWSGLSSEFLRLERDKLGHEGRPVILDFYCLYDEALNELERRSRLCSILDKR